MAKKDAKKVDIKKEFDVLVKKYQPAAKKAGEQLSKALKVAEEDVAKMYKVAQMHIEVQMKNLEKEKLYYDLGKEVAKKLMKGGLADAGLDKFSKKLEKINAQGDKVKKKIARAGKAGKKRSAKK